MATRSSDFKRNPRNPKYWPAYLGHAGQGFICGLLLPPPLSVTLAVVGYWLYQRTEFQRFAMRRDAEMRWGQDAVVDDWPSRDIADHLAGLWLGIIVGLPGWVYLPLRLLGLV